MSLLTDEGLPDPSNMNFLLQMTFGQLETWAAQTQELAAALGLFEGSQPVTGGPAGIAAPDAAGWSGADAESYRQFLLQDHQSSQQHEDAQHALAELVLWVIDTLQLIMTILLIIELLKLAMAALSTIVAVFTAGVSEAAAADMAIQLAVMEGIKRAVIFALRQMLKLFFEALPKLLLRLLPGELAGAGAGALVAANTVSSQRLSGGQALGVFVQDIGFGALTGASVQAGLTSENPLAWKLLTGGVAATGANVWAQAEVTGQGPTLQSVFDAANADLFLPEGALQLHEAAGAVRAWGSGLELERSLDGPVGVESQCGPAALYDKLMLAGKPQSLERLTADTGWRPGQGMWLSTDGPRAMAGAFARDPSLLEAMGAHPDVVVLARRAQAGDAAALASLERTFRLQGGLTLDELDQAYRSTGLTLTVVTNVGDGAHAVEFAGMQDGRVLLVDGSAGKVRVLTAAEFRAEWRGGQALMPDLEALGIRPDAVRVGPLTRLYEHLSGLDEVRATAPAEVEELPVLGKKRTQLSINRPADFLSDPVRYRFDQAIEGKLTSGDRRDELEGVLGLHLRDDLIDFDRRFVGPNGRPAGQIDAETDVAIFEVTTSTGGKPEQVGGRHLGSTENPSGKPVIVFAPDYTKAAAEHLESVGNVYVVRKPVDSVTEAQLWAQLDELIARLRSGQSRSDILQWLHDLWDQQWKADIVAKRASGGGSKGP